MATAAAAAVDPEEGLVLGCPGGADAIVDDADWSREGSKLDSKADKDSRMCGMPSDGTIIRARPSVSLMKRPRSFSQIATIKRLFAREILRLISSSRVTWLITWITSFEGGISTLSAMMRGEEWV